MRKSLCFLTALTILLILALPCAASADNLCEGATVYACSGYINDDEQPAYLIDGNPDTKWCATEENITDYSLEDICKHYIIIDLGSDQTFDTYRLFGAGEHSRDAGNDSMNPLDWRVDVSSDAKKWTEISYIYGNSICDVQVHIGDAVTARYVRLLVIEPTQSMENVVRLYEFQLTNADPSEANTKNDLSSNLIVGGVVPETEVATDEGSESASDAEETDDAGENDEDSPEQKESKSIVPLIVVIIAAAVAIGATGAVVFTKKK